ncbi:RhoGAP domain [Popillia japonica]|uniref:RhoGAP domain n=1 Tax=Popillia japonica TaxID=7064 RepID=A0AAW1KJA7_POPJA
MSYKDPYQEIDYYLEQAHIDINNALVEKSAETIVCNGNYAENIEDLLEGYIAEKCGLNGENHIEVIIDDVSDTDVDFDDHRSTDSSQFINTKGTGTQTSPSQSSTNLTCTSDSSLSPCMVSDREIFEDQDQSFSDRTIIRSQWQKSSSTSVLKKITKVNRQTRSQSDRHLSEIETTEACKWLRAAGFPQYAQMYEDMQFPIDLNAVKDDHPLLDSSVLHSLYRRLHILNKCAQFHQHRSAHTDDSEDEQCALSENWAYQSDIRRWSRTCQSEELAALGEDSKALRRSSHPHPTDELPKPESPRNKFHRAISPSRRRRRDEIVSATSGLNVLELLSKQLSDFNASNSEICDPVSPFRRSRRRKTGSLDKTDSWLHLPNSSDSILFSNIDKGEESETIDRPEFEEGGRELYTLSANQLQVLRKLALLKLTAHMEKYCSTHKTGWNWNVTKFMRKLKCPAYKDKIIFGVSITVIQQRTGLPLPKSIAEALKWLVENAANNVGIFRKPGVRSRIQHLKTIMEEFGDKINYNDQQAYDVADTVKQYFRELPEALLTYKLSETFISIFQHIPPHLRREAVLCCLLLMPDEHREALQVLLHSLYCIAQYSSANQMTESNLALCFAPTLFHHNQVVNRPVTGMPSAKELDENKAGHDCLLFLIKNYNNLFTIPEDLLNQCNSSEMKVVLWSELSLENNGDWRTYLEKCQTALLNEVKEKTRGWIVIPSHYDKIEMSYKKVADNHPLRLWKVYLEIDASPIDIFNRIVKERHLWDNQLESNRVVSQIDSTTDIYQYIRKNIGPLPLEDHCVIRSWRTNLPKGGCILVETSVEHTESDNVPNSVRRVVLASRYLIESSSSHTSKLTHMARVDKRGKMPEWYHKNYGHLLALNLHNLQNSFKKPLTTNKKHDI